MSGTTFPFTVRAMEFSVAVRVRFKVLFVTVAVAVIFMSPGGFPEWYGPASGDTRVP
jgi:hypothetical protein